MRLVSRGCAEEEPAAREGIEMIAHGILFVGVAGDWLLGEVRGRAKPEMWRDVALAVNCGKRATGVPRLVSSARFR